MSDRFFFALIAIFLAAYAVGYLTACGASTTDAARSTLATMAHAAQVADAIEADAYAARAAVCLENAETAELYATCMGPHEAILRAEIVARDALLAAEHVISATDETDKEAAVLGVMPCLLASFDDLLRLLNAAHVQVSGDLAMAVSMARALVPGECLE